MWWGYSSSLDLLDEYDFTDDNKCSGDGGGSNEENETTINVLLVGQGDNRHVLKTLSRKYNHEENININFYVCESLLENVARDLLFLVLALEPPDNVGLAEKVKFFMELYGNTLIRPTTSNYLSVTAHQLMLMITDSDYAQKILPSVILDNLKYKERDQLEIIFKYWSSGNESFDILTSWDQRMRKSLGPRYDSKYGVFDWDYHMRYRSFGADVLNMQEYKRFRDKGIAFYSEDTDPCIPNRTLASAITGTGSKIINYGYLGDIATGPYPAFGFNCDDPKMLEKVNGHAKKTATDVTEYNILKMFYEIQNRKPFPLNHSDDETYAIMTEDTSSKLQIKSLPPNGDATLRQVNIMKNNHPLLTTDKCKIVFLPTAALKDTLNKPKYDNFFDMVTFPQVMVLKNFTSHLVRALKPNSTVIVDTPKYLLNYRTEDLEKYKCDLLHLMDQCGFSMANPSFNYSCDEFMRFKVSKGQI